MVREAGVAVVERLEAVEDAALPGPLSTNYYKGSYYDVPDDTNTQVLFWNRSLFAAAGLTPPKTLSQVWVDAQKLTNKSKGIFGLGVDGTDIWRRGRSHRQCQRILVGADFAGQVHGSSRPCAS